jgi:hypothetical protein
MDVTEVLQAQCLEPEFGDDEARLFHGVSPVQSLISEI